MLTFIVQMCGSLPSSNRLSQHRIFLLQNSNLIEGIQLSQPEAYEHPIESKSWLLADYKIQAN